MPAYRAGAASIVVAEAQLPQRHSSQGRNACVKLSACAVENEFVIPAHDHRRNMAAFVICDKVPKVGNA